MTKQIKHLRKNKKSGRGKDIGKFKIKEKVSYDNEIMIVKSKRFINGVLYYILIDDKKNLHEVVEYKIWKL